MISPIKYNLEFLKEYNFIFQEIFLLSNQKSSNCKQINFLLWINLFRSLQIITMYFLPVSHEILILNFDYIYLNNMPNEFKLGFPLFGFLTNYCILKLYFNPKCVILNNIIYQILFQDNERYFLNNNSKFESNKSKSICQQIKQFIKRYIYFFQIFMLTGGNAIV